MKFALVDNTRCEASPKLYGQCPICSADMIAKCGTKRIWHWSHRGERNCDPWWETETEWHRVWKNCFPHNWQEVRLIDPAGERHIADIRTEAGLVIEIQHSPIAEAEMNAREAYYKNMVWIVDGTRLKRDRARFSKGISLTLVGAGYYVTSTPELCFPEAWLNRKAPVFFDPLALAGFDNGAPVENSQLLCLLPNRVGGQAVVALVSRSQFAGEAKKRAHLFPIEEIMAMVAEFMRMRSRSGPALRAIGPRFRGPRRRRYPRF